jgi:MoaA/NifB/PqqE/SkfB family radical SAM enzyme
LDSGIEGARHSLARTLPMLIRPEPRRIQIAVTALCNLRCIGCRYGRDFMPGAQLPWPVVRGILDDAKAIGAWDVRLYGGEPLLHPDLPKMVAHSVSLGLQTFVTTNGMLLEQKLPSLYDAGLRRLTIGYYGTGEAYDSYVQRSNSFVRLERGLTFLRERYGSEIDVQINWLLSRRSCSQEALDAVLAVAERFDLRVQVDLVHYSLPYFSEGPDRELQFTEEDRPRVAAIARALEEAAAESPKRFTQSILGIRSIPDWLLLGPEMRVPCDSHQMLWVGADGSVQQCYVTFPLGNVHTARLRDIVFTEAHRKAAKDSFQLNCPNCHCNYHQRVEKHGPSRERYRG